MDDRTRDSLSDTDGVIRAEYEWSSVAPSTAVIETVAIASDCEPTTLDSLYEIIDPDALDTIVRSNRPHAMDDEIVVSFSFAGHEVTVHSTGSVVIRGDRE